MIAADSPRTDESFARAMVRARRYLDAPRPTRRVWPVLAAAAFFAVCSMIFATVAILAPPVTLDHLEPSIDRSQTLGPPLAGAVN